MRLTEGRGVNIIQDPILGGTHFNQNLSCLSMDARWVLYGSMGGIKVENAPMAKLLMKRASLLSSTLRNRTDGYKANLISSMAA
jgi:NADPH:quinone reductase-like Zn-dependent oxidoreductase